MAPFEKAANNVAFICKRLYAQVLVDELGLVGSSPLTYSKIEQFSPDDIRQDQTDMLEKFNITVEDNMKTLPDMYWIPKLHRIPVKFRFIIASK